MFGFLFLFFFSFFGWTYPCECTGDDGCAQKGYRVGGDHHQTEEAASDGHCCWEEVVWNVDVSMKGEASVVSGEECDTTRDGRYCIHLISFLWEGKSLASQCLMLFSKTKSYIKLGGINSNTYAHSQPMLPKLAPFQSV